MSGRLIVSFIFSLLAWVVSLAFIGGAVYIHFVMGSSKDVTPLCMAGVLFGAGAAWLTYYTVTGEQLGS